MKCQIQEHKLLRVLLSDSDWIEGGFVVFNRQVFTCKMRSARVWSQHAAPSAGASSPVCPELAKNAGKGPRPLRPSVHEQHHEK